MTKGCFRQPKWLGFSALAWLWMGMAPSLSIAGGPGSTAGNPVAEVVLASQLARYAGERRDPLAMLVAASVLRGVTAKAVPGQPAALPRDQVWLAQAKEFAGERPDLLALIEDVRLAGARGVVGTVDAQMGQLAARGSRTFRLQFEGDADAAVAVMPPPEAGPVASDIDLYVTDSKGAPVCTSEKAGLPQLCRWAPRRAGQFVIRVQNRRDTPADFVLLVR